MSVLGVHAKGMTINEYAVRCSPSLAAGENIINGIICLNILKKPIFLA